MGGPASCHDRTEGPPDCEEPLDGRVLLRTRQPSAPIAPSACPGMGAARASRYAAPCSLATMGNTAGHGRAPRLHALVVALGKSPRPVPMAVSSRSSRRPRPRYVNGAPLSLRRVGAFD